MVMAGSLTAAHMRSLGRVGGLMSAAKQPREKVSERGYRLQDALRARFTAEVDPDGSLRALDPGEFERRYEARRRAYYVRLGMKSGEAKRAKKLIEAMVAPGVICAWCAREMGTPVPGGYTQRTCPTHLRLVAGTNRELDAAKALLEAFKSDLIAGVDGWLAAYEAQPA